MTACKRSDCDLEVRRNVRGHSLGYCDSHYVENRMASERKIRTQKFGDADRYVDANGYVQVITPHGKMAEHRWVMVQELGRLLEPLENVHHINGVRDDNRLENLELWASAQPYGQRVWQLVEYIAEFHAERVLAAIERRQHISANERESA